MNTANKLPLLLMLPVAAIAVHVLGGNLSDGGGDVQSVRDWLMILVGVYLVNFGVAWFMRDSWPAAMSRMLGCGLFAYICISEMIDLGGRNFDHLGQVFGGEGLLAPADANLLRYTFVAWSVGLVMMVAGIGLGFEDDGEQGSEESGRDTGEQ